MAPVYRRASSVAPASTMNMETAGYSETSLPLYYTTTNIEHLTSHTPRHFSSRVPMTGTFDRHLSHVDTCHIVGTVYLYKYWPSVRFSQATNKCNTKRIAYVCLCIWSRLVFAFPRLVCTCQDNSDQANIWHACPSNIV